MSLPWLPAVPATKVLPGAQSNGSDALRSTDRCSHVAVPRLPGDAHRLQHQTLAVTPGPADVIRLSLHRLNGANGVRTSVK